VRGCDSGCGENSNELMCCIENGIEWVAVQLLASQEGIFSMTLIVTHCNDFDSHIGRNNQNSCSVIGFGESVYRSLS
jgi:hypothetical protein